jgi:glutathione S-transferase
MNLYVSERSGNAHKARLFLSILGVEFEAVEADYAALQDPAFLAKNPRGQIPVLEVDGRYIWDSQAILVYLARRYGGEDWLPTDPEGMSEVMQWLALSENELLLGIAQARIGTRYANTSSSLILVPLDVAKRYAARGLRVMEERLAAHDWLALDRPTIAEMACFTYTALTHEADIDIAPYGAVTRWLDRVRSLPGFVAMPGMEAGPA